MNNTNNASQNAPIARPRNDVALVAAFVRQLVAPTASLRQHAIAARKVRAALEVLS